MRRSLARCSLALVLIAPTSLRAAQPDVAASPATEEGASDMSEGPAEATPAEPVEAPPRLSPRGRTRVITGAVLTGVGGALLVPMAFFTAEHLRHLSRVEQYLDVACGETEGCPPNGSISDEDRAEAATYRDQAAAARAAAIATGVAGGALIVTGLTLVVLGLGDRERDAQRDRLSLTPAVAPGRAGLVLSGRF
ncbi:MAG: hypothetical protein KC636_23310 [Myxococcales bacterium]|nr:hypothetical protein [Myxococcales bacterium]